MGPLRPSGMERMLVSAAPFFKSSDVSSVVVGQGDDHPFRPRLEAAGYQVESIPSLRSARGAHELWSVLRRVRPDVVHIHAEGAFAVSVSVARSALPAARIIRTVHSIFPSGALSRRVQSLIADRFVAEFVAPSPDVATSEEGLGRNCRTIFNWVDGAFFDVSGTRRPRDGAYQTAIIVGNSSAIKNHELALEAVMASTVKLHKYGAEDGASAREIEMLDALQDQGRLLHRGPGDPLQALLDSDVFLMPSLREGMGVALAEAIVVGVDCIVNDVQGLQWARGLPGVHMVEGDPGAWKRALLEGSSVDEVSRAPGRNIDFSPSRGAGEYVQLYRAVQATGA